MEMIRNYLGFSSLVIEGEVRTSRSRISNSFREEISFHFNSLLNPKKFVILELLTEVRTIPLKIFFSLRVLRQTHTQSTRFI